MTIATTNELSLAERWKFRLLAEGLAISTAAKQYLDAANSERALTPADYASTSGVIIVVEDQVWVNAPIAEHNAEFVTDPGLLLDLEDGALVLRGDRDMRPARVWLPPAYHGTTNKLGEAYNSYAFTHADRVRISPIEGCSMVCKFCDLPYEFRYRTKRIEGLVDAVERARCDEVQPAHHVLISGGTPHQRDIGYVRDCYEAITTTFPSMAVDVMMVPVDELMDPNWLHDIGVNEVSVNLEIFNEELAAKLMRQKAKQGRSHYLDYLGRAAEVFGLGRVRSMLMVGLEPAEDTLAGVAAVAERGAVPVLSPFRPDPATPLAERKPAPAKELEDTYLRAREIAERAGVPLGPSCVPCSHNTLTFASSGAGDAAQTFGQPTTV